MAHRLPWKPSELPEGSYIVARCSTCMSSRYPSRALMMEKAGDIPIHLIEGRLRCIARKTSRGPSCGGRMTMELASVGHKPTEARGGWPRFEVT